MSVFAAQSFRDHEQVVFCCDAASGLKAIIAIHSTVLGPALGGCRMRPYASETDALDDALQLSHAMTLKAAVADIPWGGGKAVVMGDPQKDKSRPLLVALGRFIDTLGGRYYTGEDLGTSVADMDLMAEVTPFVRGTTKFGGDPSRDTALGVLRGIEAAVRHRLGRETLKGVTVAVQGLGHVGYHLSSLLADQGACLIVSDTDPERMRRAAVAFGAKPVEPHAIHAVEADVYAPCAIGGTINVRTLPEIRARIIAGAANNQLEDASILTGLKARDILYVPDFVINAGGLLKVARNPSANEAQIQEDMSRRIGQTVDAILKEAERTGQATVAIAERRAQDRLMRARVDHRQLVEA